MTMPLTFGVELEFCVGCLAPYDETPKDLGSRVARFPSLDNFAEAFKDRDKLGVLEYRRDDCMWPGCGIPFEDVVEHMADTLREEANVTVQEEGTSTKLKHNLKSWLLKSDSSIEAPAKDCSDLSNMVGTGYRYFAVELVSPVFDFSPESLQEVAKVCDILRKRYVINTNDSTGLHVHVGNGTSGYTLANLRKLICFFWAFTPQLNTLHPPVRQAMNHTGVTVFGSFREQSMFARWYTEENNHTYTPLECIKALLQYQGLAALVGLTRGWGIPRGMAYNFQGLMDPTGFPTIEFRQHEGTFDEAAMTTWIETVVGIINFCQVTSMEALLKFLDVIRAEEWERRFDGNDEQIEAMCGPPLAESGFTVIDMLKAMKLEGPARFYERRQLYKHERRLTYRDIFGCDLEYDEEENKPRSGSESVAESFQSESDVVDNDRDSDEDYTPDL